MTLAWTPALLRSLTGKQNARATQATALTAEEYRVKGGPQLELTLKGRLCADGRREGTSMLLKADLAAPTAQALALLSVLSAAAARSFHSVTFDTGQVFLSAGTESEVCARLGTATR